MGVKSGLKRTGWLLVCLLLLLSPLIVRGADDATEAEELTSLCTLTWTGGAQDRAFALTDRRINTSCRMKDGDALTIQADRDMGTLLLRFFQLDASFRLVEREENGRLLQEQVLTTAVALTVPLKSGCRCVQIQAMGEGLRICEAAVYSPGPLPADVPHPDAPHDKTDFLLIATHPDDEWVFLGGVYPIYGKERGYAGTVAYVTLPTWERAQECINGLWIGGVRTHPFFLGFPDVRQSAPKREKDTFRQEDVTLALVRLYRQIRPVVVVTQDPENGEYGHWQHKLSASAAFDAVELAADPAYDPVSAAQYGPWMVQKVYQHFAQGISALELDVDAPLASYGGRTALDVAQAAFRAHRTQLKAPYRPGSSDEAKGDIRHFGLTWSVVGPDTAEDFFEHIPAQLLTTYLKSTEPPETATPSPTAAPSPSPTSTPLPPSPSAPPATGPSATPAATSSAWDRAEMRAEWAADHAEPLSAGVVLLTVLAVALRQIARAHHRRRQIPAAKGLEEGEHVEEGAEK